VTITVTDQAPTCNDTSTTTTVGKAVDISNLFDCDDADGEPITINFFDGEHGVTDANGTTYTPDPGFVGTDQVLFYESPA
jgi:Bacterial Ig domain